MTDLNHKAEQIWEEVNKLKFQISNILDTLLSNKDLVQLDTMPILRNEIVFPTLALSKSTSESSLRIRDRSSSSKSANNEGKFTAYDTLQFTAPTYGCLDSQTFLLSVLDHWVWGTTIYNTSKTTALLPDLTLTISKPTTKTPLACNYVISLVDSDIQADETPSWLLGIPFQCQAFESMEKNNGLQRIQPGCKATVTAVFDSPFDCWTREDGIFITAVLSLSGKFQWSHAINLQLGNVSTFKDDTYERFELQILSAMTSCQNQFRVEPLLTQPQINQSLSKAFTQFLQSLGFNAIHSNATESLSFACGLTSYLFGSLAQLQNGSNGVFILKFSARSQRQMQSLVALLASWRNQTEKSRGLIQNQGSEHKIRISSIASQIVSDSEDEQRSALLSEIEVLTHLIMLESKGLLGTPLVVSNWIRTYAGVSARSDATFWTKRLKC